MTTETRKVENGANVVAFPKASTPTVSPLKLAAKTERRKIGQDTLHLASRQHHMHDDMSSYTIEFMLAIFALITVLAYVVVS